jgi:hypothetical protein
MMPPRADWIAEFALGAARQSLARFGAERHGERVTTILLRQARLSTPPGVDFRCPPQQIG